MFWQKERKMTDFEIYCYLQFYAEKNSKTVTPNSFNQRCCRMTKVEKKCSFYLEQKTRTKQ